VLWRIFGTERDETIVGLRKLRNEEIYDVHSSPNIIRMIKSRRIILGGHLTHVEKRTEYRVLAGKPEGKKPIENPRT
jgi:hypothetical protein